MGFDKISGFEVFLGQNLDIFLFVPNSGHSIVKKDAECPWLLVNINGDKGNKKYMAFYENIH